MNQLGMCPLFAPCQWSGCETWLWLLSMVVINVDELNTLGITLRFTSIHLGVGSGGRDTPSLFLVRELEISAF